MLRATSTRAWRMLGNLARHIIHQWSILYQATLTKQAVRSSLEKMQFSLLSYRSVVSYLLMVLTHVFLPLSLSFCYAQKGSLSPSTASPTKRPLGIKHVRNSDNFPVILSRSHAAVGSLRSFDDCCTFSTIIFPCSTKQNIVFWRRCCPYRYRRHFLTP